MQLHGVLVLNAFHVPVDGGLLQDSAEDCVADDKGNDRTCSICLKILIT